MPKLPGEGDLHIEAREVGKSPLDSDDFMFIRGHRLLGETISGAGKLNLDVQDCRFERCRFEYMKFRRWSSCLAAGTERSYNLDCVFDGSRFTHLGVGQARFERCQFRNVHITNLFSHAAEFVDCNFTGKLKGAVFFGNVVGNLAEHTTRKRNEIRGNDFSALKMMDCDFRQGVDLRLQKLPAGDDYLHLTDAGRKLQAMRQRYLQQPASKLRTQIFQFLDCHEEEVREGQAELFMCAGAWFEPADERRLWRELDSL
jgi:hypothetical protein